MPFIDERLAARMGTLRARFLEDSALALQQAEPSKTDLEEALQEQIGHGRQLLEMGEAACYLASVARLRPETLQLMELALTVGVNAFGDLRAMAADWTAREGLPLEGAQELSLLVAEMERYRAELALGSRGRQRQTSPDRTGFPQVGTAEWGRMNQRRAELIRKHVRGELSEAEGQEYEALQRQSLAAVDAAFPLNGNAPSPVDPSEASGG